MTKRKVKEVYGRLMIGSKDLRDYLKGIDCKQQ